MEYKQDARNHGRMHAILRQQKHDKNRYFNNETPSNARANLSPYLSSDHHSALLANPMLRMDLPTAPRDLELPVLAPKDPSISIQTQRPD
jgi:hypothetical protein